MTRTGLLRNGGVALVFCARYGAYNTPLAGIVIPADTDKFPEVISRGVVRFRVRHKTIKANQGSENNCFSSKPFLHQFAEVMRRFETNSVAHLCHGFKCLCFHEISGSVESYFGDILIG